MKKTTFILFALIAGTAFGQNANTATESATVFAEIINPITITHNADLNFARIIGGETAGIVSVSPSGVRTGDGDLLDPASNATVSAAQFTISAADTYSYNVIVPASVTLSDGTNTMNVTLKPELNNSAPVDGVLTGTGSVGTQILKIGGDLEVGANQTQGEYDVTFDVTVTYN